MSLSAFLKNPIVERAYKTLIQVSAAQIAVLGTGQVSYKVVWAAVVSGGSAALSVLWNGAQLYLAKRKSARLNNLQNAILAAAEGIITAQQAQAMAPLPPSDNAA